MMLKVKGYYTHEVQEIKAEMTIEQAEAKIKALLSSSNVKSLMQKI